ncbi:alpha/beta-hydrolase [Mycena albidolilacea]|uniref:Alpha/beta-hydrolase n=1 Tax=Mycena albidolilacea TaxID=1033008 RepID=A0AAD7EAX5_9AGAR|nr:alpha/beta-hydrolase [Mycena albidolilacea]
MRQATLLAAFACAAVTASQSCVVTIGNGTIHGVDLPQYGQNLFLGIPYAQPPVGDLRLRPPQSINKAFGSLDATAYGPHCLSAFTTGFDDSTGYPTSEDCLTLNVIRPSGISAYNPIPVLVWIHGGFFTTGGSADLRYNATWLVQASVANGNPIMVVSINYRLASLGFLASAALAEEGSLNLGLRDQRLALHWVQENIAKFGGDPTAVTAGGFSILAHITAYSGRDDGLFAQAIIESGTIGVNYFHPTDPPFQSTYDLLIANTNCSATANLTTAIQLACIRTLPVDVFRQASLGLIQPVFDGDMIDVPGPLAAFKAGNWTQVPFLVGSNTDEGQSFAASGANTTADVEAFITPYIPPNQIPAVLELYPEDPAFGCPFNTGEFQLDPVQNGLFNTPGAANKRVGAIVGDAFMAAGARALAQVVSSEVPVYKYRFNHKPYSVSFGIQDYVGHFTEVAYTFNTQNDGTDFWVTNHATATYLGPGAPIADRALGVYMSRSWASFAATGDPNNANVTAKITWPKYSEGAQNIVWQSEGSIIEDDVFRKEGMQFMIDNIFF